MCLCLSTHRRPGRASLPHLPQGQQRKIAELEQRVASLAAALEAADMARRAAEERCRQLGGEVESSAAVFRLHYDELLRKDREIGDLQVRAAADL